MYEFLVYIFLLFLTFLISFIPLFIIVYYKSRLIIYLVVILGNASITASLTVCRVSISLIYNSSLSIRCLFIVYRLCELRSLLSTWEHFVLHVHLFVPFFTTFF